MGVLKVFDGTGWRKVGCGHGPAYSDDFNRPDGTLTAPYSFLTSDTLTIDSHELAGTTIGAAAVAVIDTGEEHVDISIDLTVAGAAFSRSGYLIWNAVDYSNLWAMTFSYYEITMFQVVAGSVINHYSSSPGAPTNPSPEATYRVTHDAGGTVTLYKAGSSFYFETGVALTSGGTLHGVGIDNLDTRLDNLILNPAEAGRLRLQTPDGSWLIECCDGESGHPLKIDVGGTWTTAVCMRVLSGPSVEYDTALFDSGTYG